MGKRDNDCIHGGNRGGCYVHAADDEAIVLKSATTAVLCSNRHRILFGGKVYNITGVMPYYTSGDLVQITAVSQQERLVECDEQCGY